jgi:hypothetical protein
MIFKYEPKKETQLKSWYNNKVSNQKSGFVNETDFLKWYNDQTKKCFYCGLKEEDSQRIVMTSLLTSKRFPQNGKRSQGKFRGSWLEFDRKKPDGKYSRTNCVLCCYFCNNDKSDVFDDVQYAKFRENRATFMNSLLNHKTP